MYSLRTRCGRQKTIAVVVTYATYRMYHWSQISSINENPGVYAWYYKTKISKKDANELVNKIQNKNEEEFDKKKKIVKNFIKNNVTRYFNKNDYYAKIEGSLKPTHEGKLEHKSNLNDSLIKSIAEKPKKIFDLKREIEDVSPKMTSPIYIGKAKNLKERLEEHKRLIRKKRNVEKNEHTENRDEDFAVRVNKRSMRHDFLYVSVKKVKRGIEKEVESILNRISFPIYGRR